MTEKEVRQTTDQRREITRRYSHALYSNALSRALRFEKQINENVSKGDKRIYFVIRDATGSHSRNLQIDEDLVKIAQGAAFGAYCELAFKPDKQVKEETGKGIRVIDPDGKQIADYIMERERLVKVK